MQKERARGGKFCIFSVLVSILLSISFYSPAADAVVYKKLDIASIHLSTHVEPLELTDSELIAPETNVGSFSNSKNKTLLIGHSSTIFTDLGELRVGDRITYDDTAYTITDITTKPKSSISMREVLKSEDTPTLILMTCAGQSLGSHDATHRLIIMAQPNRYSPASR